jgi:hypothetical protein
LQISWDDAKEKEFRARYLQVIAYNLKGQCHEVVAEIRP